MGIMCPWTFLYYRQCLVQKYFQLLIFLLHSFERFQKIILKCFGKIKILKDLKYFWIDIYYKLNKRLKQPLKFKVQMAPATILIYQKVLQDTKRLGIKGFIIIVTKRYQNIYQRIDFLHREAIISKTLPKMLKSLGKFMKMLNYMKSRPLKARMLNI